MPGICHFIELTHLAQTWQNEPEKFIPHSPRSIIRLCYYLASVRRKNVLICRSLVPRLKQTDVSEGVIPTSPGHTWGVRRENVRYKMYYFRPFMMKICRESLKLIDHQGILLHR